MGSRASVSVTPRRQPKPDKIKWMSSFIGDCGNAGGRVKQKFAFMKRVDS